MIRFVLKLLAMGAIVVLPVLGTASVAEATNWTSNGSAAGTPFTATAPTAKLTIHSPSAPGTVCTSVSATANLLGPTGPANTMPWDVAGASVHPFFAVCTIRGLTATVNCLGSAHLSALSQSGAVITGDVNTLSCTIVRGGCTITVTNGVQSTYNNTTGQLAVLAAGQSLSASAPAACDSITGFSGGGVASATFGSNTTPIGNLVYTVTSAFKPNIQHN